MLTNFTGIPACLSAVDQPVRVEGLFHRNSLQGFTERNQRLQKLDSTRFAEVFRTPFYPLDRSRPPHDYLNVNLFRSNVTCQSPQVLISNQFTNWLRGGWLEDYQVLRVFSVRL